VPPGNKRERLPAGPTPRELSLTFHSPPLATTSSPPFHKLVLTSSRQLFFNFQRPNRSAPIPFQPKLHSTYPTHIHHNMASTDEQKIILVSSDGVNIQTGMRTRSSSLSLTALLTHVTDRIIAERSMLIKNMIEDLGTPGEEPIPIMNVSLLLTVTPHPTHTDASSSGL
jgi:hypothetical protein